MYVTSHDLPIKIRPDRPVEREMDLRPVQFANKTAQENRDKNQKTGKNRDNWRFG
jgi:hypothetical protein